MRTTRTDTDRRHAVVIGASMAGLAAAAALAPHFERVTVLDRDALPDSPEHRRAVPQSRHAHGLQPGGLRALDDLLPGLIDGLRLDGARLGDAGADCVWTVGGNRFVGCVTGAVGIGITRPYLEHDVRARVAALPAVTIRDGVEVCSLLSSGRVRVTGVELGRGGDGPRERLEADLVVDATGKVSALPQWLRALGYEPPPEESVGCRMAYLSRRWRLAGERAPREILVVCTPAERPRFGVMIAQEDGTHIVTLGGLMGECPDGTDTAYLDFAATLPDPTIADALVGATPVSGLQPAHFPASRRRRYDRMREFPAGLIALGDAIAAFNPMYGQGMTVAALEAVTLRSMLAKGGLDPHAFFARAHRIEDVAWKIATGGDLRHPDVDGRRTPGMRFMNWYLDRLTAGARRDPVLARKFLMVAGFRAAPESMFAPRIAWRVLRSRPEAAAVPGSTRPQTASPIVS